MPINSEFALQGALVLIEKQTISSGTTVTFSSLPTIYSRFILFFGLNTNNGTGGFDWRLRINNNSGAIYNHSYLTGLGVLTQSLGDTSILINQGIIQNTASCEISRVALNSIINVNHKAAFTTGNYGLAATANTSDCTRVDLFISAGAFTSGYAAIYGIL